MNEPNDGVRPDENGPPAEAEARPGPAAAQAGPDLTRRIDELTRAYAELVNDREAFKRRLERERERQLDAQKGEIARVLLDTLDELELALRGGGGDAARLADGLRLIVENTGKRVESLGLSKVPAEGHLFDPSLHEAIDLVPTPNPEQDGRVFEEARAGWRLGERVIRAARVRVGRLVATSPRGDGAGEPPPGTPPGE